MYNTYGWIHILMGRGKVNRNKLCHGPCQPASYTNPLSYSPFLPVHDK